MKGKVLSEWNKNNPSKQMKNTRNATAGAIKLLDSRECAGRKLSFVAHTCTKVGKLQSQSEFFEWCHANDMPYPLHFVINDLGVMVSHLEDHPDSFQQPLDFETDGRVVKTNSFALRHALGTSNTSPNWAKALKTEVYSAETIVESITWEISQYGVLTPVANVKPVDIAGSTVSRATLFNVDYIREKQIRTGSRAEIQKAGKIIPNIVRVLDPRSSEDLGEPPPSYCPYCKKFAELTTGDGVTQLICVNPECGGMQRRKAEALMKCLEIDGIGPALIEQLWYQGFLRGNPWQIFELTDDEFRTVPRMGVRASQKVLKSIDKCRKIPLNKFIEALGINGIGERASMTIAKHFKTVDAFIQSRKQDIPGLGEVLTKKFWDNIDRNDGEILTPWADLEDTGKIEILDMPEEKPQIVGKLSGMTFCVTGELQSHTREQIHKMIIASGGDVKSSVTKAVTHLVCGENVGQTKLNAARKNKTTMIDESTLLEMIKQ